MTINEQKEKFSQIALEHYHALRRFAVSLCKNDFDADDLVSETLLRGLQHFSKLRDASKTKPWLLSILHNQFVSTYRDRKHFAVLEENNAIDQEQPFSLFESLAKTDYVAVGNPESSFVQSLTRNQIEKAVDGLPLEYKSAFVLCDMEDFSYAEISSMLDIPIGTVRSRIARARSILQKQLWQQAEDLGIRTSKSPKEKTDYTCTCGKEENNIQINAEINT